MFTFICIILPRHYDVPSTTNGNNHDDDSNTMSPHHHHHQPDKKSHRYVFYTMFILLTIFLGAIDNVNDRMAPFPLPPPPHQHDTSTPTFTTTTTSKCLPPPPLPPHIDMSTQLHHLLSQPQHPPPPPTSPDDLLVGLSGLSTKSTPMQPTAFSLNHNTHHGHQQVLTTC